MEEAVEWTVGVARPVGQGVMLGMRRGPADSVAFQGHRAKHEQDRLHCRVGHEAAMREHAMVAHRNADCAEHIHGRQQRQIRPVDRALPQEPDGEAGSEQRHDDDEQHNGLVREAYEMVSHERSTFLAVPGRRSWRAARAGNSPGILAPHSLNAARLCRAVGGRHTPPLGFGSRGATRVGVPDAARA
jgi:hypothetical protein